MSYKNDVFGDHAVILLLSAIWKITDAFCCVYLKERRKMMVGEAKNEKRQKKQPSARTEMNRL